MDTNTLLGALVGGGCSIFATMLGHWYQNKKERRINRAIILDYLKRTTDTFCCYYYNNVAPECLEAVDSQEYMWRMLPQARFSKNEVDSILNWLFIIKIILQKYNKGIRSEGYNNLSDIKKRQYLDAYIKVNSVDLEILEEIKKLLDKYK
jgi:hypothetical protein